MDWIYCIPEPLRTLVATFIALLGLLTLVSPLLIFSIGTGLILMSDSKNDEESDKSG